MNNYKNTRYGICYHLLKALLSDVKLQHAYGRNSSADSCLPCLLNSLQRIERLFLNYFHLLKLCLNGNYFQTEVNIETSRLFIITRFTRIIQASTKFQKYPNRVKSTCIIFILRKGQCPLVNTSRAILIKNDTIKYLGL